MSDPIYVDTQQDSVVEIQVYDYPTQRYKELRIDSFLGNIKIILDEKQTDVLAKRLRCGCNNALHELAPKMMSAILEHEEYECLYKCGKCIRCLQQELKGLSK